MYPELGIYRERNLLQIVERLGTVRPAGACTGGGCPAVPLSPHSYLLQPLITTSGTSSYLPNLHSKEDMNG